MTTSILKPARTTWFAVVLFLMVSSGGRSAFAVESPSAAAQPTTVSTSTSAARDLALAPRTVVPERVEAPAVQVEYTVRMGTGTTVHRQENERWVVGQPRVMSTTDEDELPTP